MKLIAVALIIWGFASYTERMSTQLATLSTEMKQSVTTLHCADVARRNSDL